MLDLVLLDLLEPEPVNLTPARVFLLAVAPCCSDPLPLVPRILFCCRPRASRVFSFVVAPPGLFRLGGLGFRV